MTQKSVRQQASRASVYLLASLLVLGCGSSSIASRDATSGISAGVRFLLLHADEDGGWRSESYAALGDGASLTPLVLLGFLAVRDHVVDPELGRAVDQALARGVRLLASLVPEEGNVEPEGLTYPVLSAALTVRLLSDPRFAEHRRGRDGWLNLLRANQLGGDLGWEETDPQYGGWGYNHEIPRKPRLGAFVPAAPEANLSATVFALDALDAAGVEAGDPVMASARIFVERCQNYASSPDELQAELDDGGFFFIYDDPVRNKAGFTRVRERGALRFHSYGSATADGLRALILVGRPAGDGRRQAARRWLETAFLADSHPGRYALAREGNRDAVYYYYSASVAQAFLAAGVETLADGRDWRRELGAALLRRQRSDGAWSNPLVLVREDDPMVATAMALMALGRLGPSPASAVDL